MDPRLDDSLDYKLELLEQANEFGFDEIVLDYISVEYRRAVFPFLEWTPIS